MYNVVELPKEHPEIAALRIGSGNSGRVRVTMSGLGCSWNPEMVLVLYHHESSSGVERARAPYPDGWLVTAELERA